MPARALSVSSQMCAAIAEKAVGLALGKGRVGEQRRRDRLKRERHAQLLHHVGFAGEVEVHLHGAVRYIMSRPSLPTFGM